MIWLFVANGREHYVAADDCPLINFICSINVTIITLGVCVCVCTCRATLTSDPNSMLARMFEPGTYVDQFAYDEYISWERM